MSLTDEFLAQANALYQDFQAHDALQSDRLERARMQLELLNPHLVLQRGYALLTDSHGHAVTSVGQARLGDALRATLADGVLDVTVDQPRLL